MWCLAMQREPLRLRPTTASDGFTLIEVLVALAVFSIAVLAHLNLQTENTRTASSLQDKAIAQIVAENRIAELLLLEIPPDLGTESGEEAMAGQNWVWEQIVTRTPGADLRQIDVSVRIEDAEQVLASVTAFRRP